MLILNNVICIWDTNISLSEFVNIQLDCNKRFFKVRITYCYDNVNILVLEQAHFKETGLVPFDSSSRSM